MISQKYTIFAVPKQRETVSGRSSVRLEYTSGGRVVAGSNPVTPTDGKLLIFNRISRVFLLQYIAGKMTAVHKWYINSCYLIFLVKESAQTDIIYYILFTIFV